MNFRAEIGKGRVVVPIMIVVQSVPIFQNTIRVRIIVLRTKKMPANTAGTLEIIRRAEGAPIPEIGMGRVVMPIMIVVQSVPR